MRDIRGDNTLLRSIGVIPEHMQVVLYSGSEIDGNTNRHEGHLYTAPILPIRKASPALKNGNDLLWITRSSIFSIVPRRHTGRSMIYLEIHQS